MQATTLFKEFVSGIYEDDLSYIKDQIEPKMYAKASKKVSEAHKALQKEGLELKV